MTESYSNERLDNGYTKVSVGYMLAACTGEPILYKMGNVYKSGDVSLINVDGYEGDGDALFIPAKGTVELGIDVPQSVLFFMHRSVQMKLSTKLTDAQRASREDETSLLARADPFRGTIYKSPTCTFVRFEKWKGMAKRMKKRRMAGLLAITILAAALSGCGEQKADSARDKTSAQQESAAAEIHTEEKNAVAASQIQSEISKKI